MAGTTVSDYLPGANPAEGIVANALQNAIYSCDITIEDINHRMGQDKRETIKSLLLSKVDMIHEFFVNDLIDYYKDNAHEMSGTREVFQELHQKDIKVGVTTGFPREIAQTIIDKLGWEKFGLIDNSVTSDEVALGRPSPDMIYKVTGQEIIQDVQNTPWSLKLIKVGDTVSDIKAAKNANCLAVGVTTGTCTREQLLEAGADKVIDNLKEILDLV